VLKTFLLANVYLSREPISAAVDRCTDDRGKLRIDQSLSTYHDEDAKSPWVSLLRSSHSKEITPLQTSA